MQDRRRQLRMIEHERRRQPRMNLALPVRVQGQYPDGVTWELLVVNNNSTDQYWLYWGNPAPASPLADGHNIFQLFDDFSGGAVDTAVWTCCLLISVTLTCAPAIAEPVWSVTWPSTSATATAWASLFPTKNSTSAK